MAESVLSFAIEKLATFVIAEAELLGSLSQDVTALKNELATIKEVLKDAEKKAEEDDTINEWLRQVRDIGYQIEDVIDDYILLKELPQQQQQQQRQRSSSNTSNTSQLFLMVTRIRKWLNKAVACVSELKPKHELASKIGEIKGELSEISSRRERYKFIASRDSSSSNERYQYQQDRQVCSLFVDDSDIFGIEDHKAEIIKWLNLEKQHVHQHVAECHRSVIAVVGMGGIGKTTLVRKVYEDEEVRSCFSFYAWVTVSQSYKWKVVLNSIYQQVHPQSSLQLETSDEVNIINDLRKHLKDERYIVVFDDVWDVELWRSVNAALPTNNKNSKILMTTRDKNIALHWMASLGGHTHHVYDLQPLPKDAAWDLFCHKTFVHGICPPELEQLSRQMIEKCEGLPLAIVAIAGLLSTRMKVPSEWNKVQSGLGFELGSNRHFSSTTKVLLLSYHELPYYLKPCFLYFGVLPGAYSIDCMRLIRLWIGEGFIQNQRGKTLEEVAEEYLNELVHKNLVQVYAEANIKKSRLFRVHDILREMIILPKLDNLCFCQVLSQDNSPTSKQFRRISIHTDFFHDNNSINVSEMLDVTPGVRSLLWFVEPLELPDLPLRSLLKVAYFFKVLDLEGAPINHIPDEFGNLPHLRYLSLKKTNVEVIPKSIGRLLNLQTLNLKHCLVVELPREIGQCNKLRHVLTFRLIEKSKQAVKIYDGVLENFKELQKLAYIEVHEVRLIEELQHLKQLRRLAITKVKKEHGRGLCCAIEKMKHLRSLSIESANHEVLDIQWSLRSPPLLLERLYLKGRLEILPDWVKNLKNLAMLRLVSSRLEDDPGKILQLLPNLVQLTLNDAYLGEKLDFGCTNFSKLEILGFYDLHNLKSLVGMGLPSLREVEIDRCLLFCDYPDEVAKIITKKAIRVCAYVHRAAFMFERASNNAKQRQLHQL
ncbi:disease resistance protein RPM1 [Beta vulgaris subsp. vulgaris]|uniref:disease resistance protein RPM1 n=1 Tax=Beta vulgaris subsp. vulgaris TaxID=3555 RepID=UPI002037279C|nr:disease resistance protein RPM1 [Beta vulgaris subsp. vulgaris]